MKLKALITASVSATVFLGSPVPQTALANQETLTGWYAKCRAGQRNGDRSVGFLRVCKDYPALMAQGWNMGVFSAGYDCKGLWKRDSAPAVYEAVNWALEHLPSVRQQNFVEGMAYALSAYYQCDWMNPNKYQLQMLKKGHD